MEQRDASGVGMEAGPGTGPGAGSAHSSSGWSGAGASLEELPSAAGALHLLCAALHTQMQLTDDHELLEGPEAVLSVSDFKALASYLVRLVERLAELQTAQGTPLAVEGSAAAASQGLLQRLRLSAFKLLNLMIALNERRGLFPISVFFIKLPLLANWAGDGDGGVGFDGSAYYMGPGDNRPEPGRGMGGGGIPAPPQPGRKERLLLSCTPQVVPFAQRVEIFQRFLAADKAANIGGGFGWGGGNGVQVRRDEIVRDAFQTLQRVPAQQLKGRLRIEFISAQGYHEAGIDGGGLFKEFLDVLTHQAWDPSLGLFVTLDSQQLWPNPASLAAFGAEHLQYYEFLGKMLGKAMYDKILVDGQFCEPFLNALKGQLNHIDDLACLDEQLHRSLIKMKSMSSDELRALDLSFEAERIEFGLAVSAELVPGGRDIRVTKENVSWYVHRLAHFKLNEETRPQCRAFLVGFHELVPLRWLRMFSPRELQLLISGDTQRLDLDDLRRHVAYHGYADREPYIEAFWEVVGGMTAAEQGQLLKFVTSCSRKPLLGFAHLEPRLGIQVVPAIALGDDPNGAPRLPSAATCMNLLKLPRYSDVGQLREKLLYAIGSNSGFELS